MSMLHLHDFTIFTSVAQVISEQFGYTSYPYPKGLAFNASNQTLSNKTVNLVNDNQPDDR